MHIVLPVALLVFLLVGLSAHRSASTRDDYFVAGRAGSKIAITGSLFATAVGGSATVGVVGLGYTLGLTGAWWTLVGVPGLLLLGLVVVPRLRAYNVYTLPGLLETVYGTRVSVVAAILIVIAWTGIVAGQIVAAGLLLAEFGAGSKTLWMAGFTVVLIVYAVLGGQRAVIKTDVVQAGVILLGLGVAVVSLVSAQGGPTALGEAIPSGSLAFPTSSEFDWTDIGKLLLLVGVSYMVGPDMYSRMLSARTTSGARSAALYTAIALIPVAFLAAGMGMVARALAPDIAPETALPWLIGTALPETVAAILLLGLVAALMSSADSTLLGQGIVLANDIVRQLWHLSDRHTVLLARLAVAVLGLASLAIASYFGGVIASLMFAYSVFAAGVVGPVILGLFGGRYRPTANVALLGLCLGGSLGLLGALPMVTVPLKPLLPVIGLAVSVLVPLVITKIQCRYSQSDLVV